MRKLNIRAFGLAGGIVWGLSAVFMGLASMWFGYGEEFIDFISSFYIGYSATLGGVVVGGIWAFIDGFLVGAFFAWLYNRFLS